MPGVYLMASPTLVEPPAQQAATIQRLGLGYVYEPESTNLRIQVDYIRPHSDALKGEILVTAAGSDGQYRHVLHDRLDLLSRTARTRFAKDLQIKTKLENSEQLVEGLCMGIVKRERTGEPFVYAGGNVTPPERLPDTVDKILPAGKPTIFHAKGKTGKGYLATACCVAVEHGIPLADLNATQGHALYLDWEDDKSIFDNRISEIANGMNVPAPHIRYRECRGPLRHQLHPIMREIDACKISLVVVDSVVMAAGRNEGQGAEEVAMSFYDALRHMAPCTIMLIHHSTDVILGDGKGNGRVAKAYGSQFFTNLARSVWELRKDQKPGEKWSTIGLYHSDTNHGFKHEPFAIGFDWTVRGVCSVYPAEIRDSEALARPLTVTDRILNALYEPRLVSELSIALDESEASIRAALVKGKGRHFTRLDDQRWARVYTEFAVRQPYSD